MSTAISTTTITVEYSTRSDVYTTHRSSAMSATPMLKGLAEPAGTLMRSLGRNPANAPERSLDASRNLVPCGKQPMDDINVVLVNHHRRATTPNNLVNVYLL
jgi:hypothetical protein